MMYSEKLAAAIKVNGKILREAKDTVFVPFGAEYSVYLKNLHSRRVLVNIQIDGHDVAPGGLVIYGNQAMDLERFIINGNLSKGNKFKFIERTDSVEKHRGVGVEDGLVRIAYKFEKEPTRWLSTPYYGPNVRNTIGSGNDKEVYTARDVSSAGGASYTKGILRNASGSVSGTAFINQVQTQSALNDAGITVPGSESSQQFQTASWFETEDVEHVLVIKLLGETDAGVKIQKPVTVKHKPRCITCNKQNKAHAKFCVECGTHLTIYA